MLALPPLASWRRARPQVWSLIKLDLPADSESLTTSIALNVIPLVVRSLDTCSPQVWLGTAAD